MSLIIFSHANSFPASTYGVLFKSLRARGYAVRAPEKFGHDPAYPVSSNWPHLVQQLADFAAPEIERHGQPAWLVGHSLGGFLSLMCAARHPALGGHGVKGVLLLDSPVLGGWRARALELAKRTQLVGSISPGKISRKRRNAWPDAQAAFDHFAHKKAFARWEPQVLRDYIAHATHDETTEQGVRRVLGFERDVETAIYNTLPHNLDRLLRRHPLPCPVAFIGGTESLEMKQVGMAMTHRLVGRDHPERLLMVEGSHLFPMEKPQETAATIDAALRSLGA
ncbi:MAG: alpha/beta hydrolase [Thiobacillus sp.]|jgi:pimeloyl-ACP methyl ester carboxylesterase|uniref:alpha/beta fold hydrolase n=1 Tax=Hydrogenophaga sp. TaxID=1904254 RepID=UPI0027292E7F|nr:alpha/beta hydrolase [Hydrogenophaga sp.]MBW8315886.1 alpha/beta hydrolase [Hydrogenophaga sp.]MBW8467251.1 alpha/beta hydrolase [Thiobacillus sp.]MDO9030363.1 alpha/beta hydrolase [Hydrogenophaga sp.]